MSREHGWNHAQCPRCWLTRWGLTREPVRVKDPDTETCCYCGVQTNAGIYIRVKPGDPAIRHCPEYLITVYGAFLPRTQLPATDPPGSDRPASPPSA